MGQICAQLTHASDESAFLCEELTEATRAVVLAAPNEMVLAELEQKLQAAGIAHRAIREPDMNNQLTAIGLFPQPKKNVKKLLGRLPLVK
jgi:peptidyl-tRNA hydrolase